MNKISVSQTWLFPTKMLPDFYNNQSLQRAFRSSLMQLQTGCRIPPLIFIYLCNIPAIPHKERKISRLLQFVCEFTGHLFSEYPLALQQQLLPSVLKYEQKHFTLSCSGLLWTCCKPQIAPSSSYHHSKLTQKFVLVLHQTAAYCLSFITRSVLCQTIAESPLQ